jgi:hypothetical protein
MPTKKDATMADVPERYTGALTIDITSLKDDIIDLKPGAMQRLRREKPGIESVLSELASTKSKHEDAGISATVYGRILTRTQKLEVIREKSAIVAKMAEVLLESEVWLEHDRENDISLLVDSVKSTEHRTGSPVTALFEDTIKYNGQFAEKAAKTRKKNALAAGAADPAGADANPKAPAKADT